MLTPPGARPGRPEPHQAGGLGQPMRSLIERRAGPTRRLPPKRALAFSLLARPRRLRLRIVTPDLNLQLLSTEARRLATVLPLALKVMVTRPLHACART